MKNKSSIVHDVLELAKAYAGSGSVNVPEDIAEFIQFAYDKLNELNVDTSN